MKPEPSTHEPDADDADPADMPVCEGEKLAYFRAGIDAARAELARGEGIPHEQVQHEMNAYIDGLIAKKRASGE